jgi:hypothetical protein
MRMTTLSEAQKRLPELVEQAQQEAIGLTSDDGSLVGLLTGVNEDDLDALLVETPAFRALIARSRASLQSEPAISAANLLAEIQARLEDQSEPGR